LAASLETLQRAHQKQQEQNIKLPPWWKIRRELIRPLRQLGGLINSISTLLLGSWYFDTFLARGLIRTEGNGPITEKVAIYVIYAPTGLCESHIRSVEYITSRGYGVVVVSNAQLSEVSKQKLKTLCKEIIERPNFGYDFGAYRQGVLSLESQLNHLNYLLLINDSTWFPILGHDWIQQAESQRKDFVGAASNYGISRVIPGSIRDFEFNYHSRHKNFHYCSFALLVGKKVFTHPAFFAFWKRFPLTNVKNRTVRRGEIGLSKLIIKRGFTHCETLDIPNLNIFLKGLSRQELALTLEHMIIPEEFFLKGIRERVFREALTLPASESDDLFRSFILVVVSRIGISYALPYLNILLKGSMFLKKSPLWLDQESRNKTLDFVESISSNSDESYVLSEAKFLGGRLA